MFAKPQSEHQWLDQLIGDWTFEHDCKMPDGNSSATHGKMTCRSLGGMWLICESSGESAEGGAWSSIMTLGYDPAQHQYVGTFVGSMMANMWPYRGVLDADGKTLPLDSEGPTFDGTGTAKYRDTIKITGKDSWLLISEMQGDDGAWITFMNGKHERV
ncbi:DUF1579 domain-containing protein [Rubripirellula amarantea]|uniref:DUF1579 domain-containing protein n=1 Tax=Rubripirellula amarantea TaxID=2527999 RepID=A0A5C5WFX6_9BACT|nr:DUF1579 domain-containing protein [Rubripirellula amarantea]MDA8743700.1 DUF1579 domain-containing protein [Rubripirellula amarantea]TWT49766.1 hypothetical protein Pla22_49680 [Rubripirellula amarantea]